MFIAVFLKDHCQVSFFLNLNDSICNVLLIIFLIILVKTGQTKASAAKMNKSSGMFLLGF